MLVYILASLCAFFVKGLCGFANTLVFTAMLSFTSSNVSISPIDLLLGYPTNLILTFRERRRIDLKICLPLSALVLAGSVPGILFLKNADAQIIKIVFGLVTALIGAQMLYEDLRGSKGTPSKLTMAVIGLLSGLLCGLYGVGVLLGAYIGRATEDSHAFKANICFVFVVENTLRIALYFLLGIITPAIVLRALSLVPFMLAGLCAGMASGRVLDEKLVKRIVLAMLIVSGAALVGGNL